MPVCFDLQVVFVKWGKRYGTEWLNRHVKAIRRNASCAVRYVCITDDNDLDSFDRDIEVLSFPNFVAPFEQLKIGMKLKLAIFSQGILTPGVPAIYLDLDSCITGDVAKLAEYLRNNPGMHMLSGHYLQWWRFQRHVRPVIGSKFYHANGSAIGFMPEEFDWLFQRFNELFTGQPYDQLPKYLKTDDHFISFQCRDGLSVFPRSLIVKYSDEYFAPFHFLESLRKSLPWVAARRKDLVAISFPGVSVKPDRLGALNRGDLIRYKWLKARWEQDQLIDYWREPMLEEQQ